MAGARSLWTRRLAWLAALWAGGVAALGVVAALLKWLMRAVGLG